MSEALLQEEHAILLLTATEPQEPHLLRGWLVKRVCIGLIRHLLAQFSNVPRRER
jgi:hypothetical protein